MNILKLLILTPLLFFLSVMIAGSWWPLAMAIALIGGGCWFWADQAVKRDAARQAQANAQQVEVTRQNMVKAQVEAEQARVRAEQAKIDAERNKLGQFMRDNWN